MTAADRCRRRLPDLVRELGRGRFPEAVRGRRRSAARRAQPGDRPRDAGPPFAASPISPSPCRGWARARSACSAAMSRRREWLPKVASGEAIAAFAMTEPETGSDAANIAMRARCATATNGCSVGEKTYIRNGAIADVLRDFARTGEGEGARGHFGLHRPRRRSRPGGRRADRGHRAASARAAEVSTTSACRPMHRRRARRRLQGRDADAEPVPGDGRRGGARLRPARARRGARVRDERASSAAARSPTMR